jgi:hypothetical protein
MEFKKWFVEKESNQQEVSTSTSCVAGFARKAIPGVVTRQWLGHWAEEDPFFKKNRVKEASFDKPPRKCSCGKKINGNSKMCQACKIQLSVAG